ncbi:MAG TPA: class II aldolase/adducin family protein [Actinomycetota bacterium]|nr:class II aldolase/adducin family protein [Actinomycetota bacterium]
MTGASAAIEELRRAVSLGCRVLAREGHGDLVWGHVSSRDPDGRGVWIKRAGLGFEEVAPGDVHLVTPSGEVTHGEGRRHAEYPIHTEAIAARDDVRAVVHTHAPHAVAFGALETPLVPLSHEGTLFVPPDIARFTHTGDLILTTELGRELAIALGPRNAVLLRNHGIVTVGPDVATAVMTAVLLERACRTQLAAMAAGTISRWSDDDEALAKRDRCYAPAQLEMAWSYLVRALGS